jgi:hypothetical protein
LHWRKEFRSGDCFDALLRQCDWEILHPSAAAGQAFERDRLIRQAESLTYDNSNNSNNSVAHAVGEYAAERLP